MTRVNQAVDQARRGDGGRSRAQETLSQEIALLRVLVNRAIPHTDGSAASVPAFEAIIRALGRVARLATLHQRATTPSSAFEARLLAAFRGLNDQLRPRPSQHPHR